MRQHDRPPRLVLRFAVQSALTLAVAAAGILWFVHRDATSRAEGNVRFHAQFVADTIARDNLRRSDFQRAVSPARRARLDWLFKREVLVGGALRVKLYRADGLVTYSSEQNQIGTFVDEAGPRRAAAGFPSVDVSTLDAEGGGGSHAKVLETYVPVTLGGRHAGAFELYDDYGPVAAAARAEFTPIAIALALVLLALYAALFPILRRVTTRLRRQMGDLEHQALHDSLTGLPNRLLFRDRVEQALLAARRDGDGFAVLLIDLDRFKEINDTLGHQSGDRMLEEVGRRLRETARESDTVARLGGDEFAVLGRQIDSPDAAFLLAERVQEAISQPLAHDGILLDVAASIGITLFPEHGEDVDSLLRRADVAMYLSKESHSGAELYAVERDNYSPSRLRLVGELRRALEQGELVLHFQPQAELASGRIAKVEALVRWQHPERGLLPPSDFVPLAEHTGLIRQLTVYVLDQALAQCAAWRREGREIAVAVNVTGRDLLDLRLPDEVAELLAKHEVPASQLELEIAENTILTDPVRARSVLTRLSVLGVTLAIDDFGSGNSSLGYLKRLPVDVLKIDRSFVTNMTDDADDATIVRSTIDLGHNLGLRVVAEGVETEETRLRLAALGCDTIQGYLIGRPALADAFGLDEDVAAAV